MTKYERKVKHEERLHKQFLRRKEARTWQRTLLSNPKQASNLFAAVDVYNMRLSELFRADG